MHDPWRDLGLDVPEGEDLVAHFLAEHGGDFGCRPNEDGTVEAVIGFGGVDVCTPWPTDAELLAARTLIPGGCGVTVPEGAGT